MVYLWHSPDPLQKSSVCGKIARINSLFSFSVSRAISRGTDHLRILFSLKQWPGAVKGWTSLENEQWNLIGWWKYEVAVQIKIVEQGALCFYL